MAGNKFASKNFEEVTIMDENGHKVGEIRIKPNRVMWKPKSTQQWFGMTLDKFKALAEQHGTKQKK